MQPQPELIAAIFCAFGSAFFLFVIGEGEKTPPDLTAGEITGVNDDVAS